MSASGNGYLFIVSGPAGSGKTTVCARLQANVPGLQRVVTSTTRPPRSNERDTVDYYFLDRKTFQAKIAAGEFYEHAEVHNKLYGTLKSEIRGKLAEGRHLLLNIDVQGASHIRKAAQNDPYLRGTVVSIFIMPPSVQELESRLRARKTDTEAEIRHRMTVALEEMKQSTLYDHTLLSGTPDQDFQAMLRIYQSSLNGG